LPSNSLLTIGLEYQLFVIACRSTKDFKVFKKNQNIFQHLFQFFKVEMLFASNFAVCSSCANLYGDVFSDMATIGVMLCALACLPVILALLCMYASVGNVQNEY